MESGDVFFERFGNGGLPAVILQPLSETTEGESSGLKAATENDDMMPQDKDVREGGPGD